MRKKEIKKVLKFFQFDQTIRLKLNTTKLETYPIADLTKKISNVLNKIQPTIIYVPFPGDAHTDHEIVFKTSLACCKWFRFSGIKCIKAYETLSETNFNVNPLSQNFKPNLYINISQQMEKKLEGISIYKSEIGNHPFPRSNDSIKALAKMRGSESGFIFAESFLVIKQIKD